MLSFIGGAINCRTPPQWQCKCLEHYVHLAHNQQVPVNQKAEIVFLLWCSVYDNIDACCRTTLMHVVG